MTTEPGLTNDGAKPHRDSPDTVGLTDADRRKLGAMAKHGIHAYTNSSRGGTPPTPMPDAETCAWCGEPTPKGWCTTCSAEEFLYRTVGRYD